MAAAVAAGMHASGTASDSRSHARETHSLRVSKALVVSGGLRLPAATEITGAYTVTAADAGKTFLVTQQTAASSGDNYDITLPPLRECLGATFTFQLKAASTRNVNIKAPTADLPGGSTPFRGVLEAVGSLAGKFTNKVTLTFVASVAAVGDRIVLRYAAYDATAPGTYAIVVRALSGGSAAGISTA